MKQAAQIKPIQKGQKRTRQVADNFAVTAVNSTPLNIASAVQEELLQEPPCKQKEVGLNACSLSQRRDYIGICEGICDIMEMH
jgi:hypothetical protein